MSPRTPLIPLAVLAGVGLLLGACGEPPRPLPSSPPYAPPSAGPISIGPSVDLTLPTAPPLPTAPTTYPAYPTTRPTTIVPTTTPPPETVQATATPSHAPRCQAQPTGAQILALVKGQPGVPDKPMRIYEGPFCSGTWSFATVEVTGEDADELEPLMVVSTGAGTTLALVAAGSDVCIDRVQTSAPPGIRVLACGF
ncbi:hypothetical protein JIG36_15490 [Actinoplanes sp. LDG1-06]|uniref:Uncharacterized protein n=1 Tax=Paractinoplanes ovalisporus TaxID=2810368 RepID=A0ABS2AAV5_9ACTN|nr:hypothetical protein [Actinoplanes ovalisporus]MBM2616962.1 hypothetical protein [Actinoplanes ovalisporus]